MSVPTSLERQFAAEFEELFGFPLDDTDQDDVRTPSATPSPADPPWLVWYREHEQDELDALFEWAFGDVI